MTRNMVDRIDQREHPGAGRPVELECEHLVAVIRRDYYASRVEVNDAMAALLVGSRLAAHTLSLTAGSTATLGQLFPAVEHVARFNMRSDIARQYLNNADHHIASVAVPYALATHEDFVMAMLDFLKQEGRTLIRHGKPIRAWNMHTVLFETCGATELEDWMQSFHVLRPRGNLVLWSPHEGYPFFPGLLKKVFGRVHDQRAGADSVFWCRREGDRPRRRHEVTFQVRIDEDRSARFLSRPGTFGYGRFDDGSRAMIEVAEIHGEFTGELTARTRLVVHGTGRVTGTIRYGSLVVEDGGMLSGDVKQTERAAGNGAVRPAAEAVARRA